MASTGGITLLAALLAIIVSLSHADAGEKITVTYDGRSLLFNGKRELLYSGGIHYPRSPPEMWPDILDKARHGGLNVIETYIFWNAHEPVRGQRNFEGSNDVVKFLKLVQEKGMYVCLRVGPFIQAEWNHGGLPYWLREVPDIVFRSDNEPFKKYMQEFVVFIIDKLKAENLFAPQGGPIIMGQIENEYNHVQRAFREKGDSYVQWAAKLAVGLNLGIPWVMCKQTDAPDPVINACNGRHCGDTFAGPNKPNKPFIWTENWTAQYRVFGDPPSQRSAEDIAYSVARFFAKNGAMVNYYMYYGGTNFGRTTSAFTTTRYYDEAPLDEYGLQKEPKWSHLRDVHRAINLCKKALLEGKPTAQKLNEFHEVIVYERQGSDLCAAFLTNNHTENAGTINFRGQEYYLPSRSISILPDCKTVVYNTQTIVSQHNSRNYNTAASKLDWEVYSEAIPTTKEVPVDSEQPRELYNLLKDASDYAWYTTRIELGPEDLPRKNSILPVLRVVSNGHGMLAFCNGVFIGAAHGSHEEKGFGLQVSVNLTVGVNQITFLCYTIGLPDSGAYMEHRFAGPTRITLLGLNTGTIDLTDNGWGHQVSIQGEKQNIFTEEGAKKFQWKKATGEGPPVTWYKARFATPEGRDPVAIRMTGMGKGQIWINGKSIGRHWMSYLSPLRQPSQSEYHIPRAFLNKKDNLVVVLEEEKSNPEKVEIVLVDRDTICSYITDAHPPNVKQFASKKMKLHAIVDDVKTEAGLKCPNFKKVTAVEFASFGDPQGACGGYDIGTCNSPAAKQVVEQHCMGKSNCTIPMDPSLFPISGNPCPQGRPLALAIQVKCSR
ncbi:beta-galactosidase 13-like [Neltuma alba]|uniref:beta-galactosidase 13-like n=1 Tax=Neltuma alba TaxID=207710 RepID=UPI0010A50D6E|nr:beta-galactosidase 13-like [Prosopis alba]